ncbi:MAG TPA: acyl carrier protein [Polyangiales bacterium]|jgi:acyl carrier protein|nr:acyl carrier protein [Polyangiales bacterium]
MTSTHRELVRNFIRDCLVTHNDEDELDDRESLFLSGRLDSLSVTKLVVFLEENFEVDFGSHPFDVGELDSVEQILQFAGDYGAAAAE